MCWKTILQRQRASYLLRCACACMAPTPPCFRIGGFLLLLSLTFEHGCCAAQANEVVRVMEKADGWWFCSNGSSEGWYGLFLLFPASLLCIFSRDNHYCPCINCVTIPLSCTSLCYHLFLSPSLSLFFFSFLQGTIRVSLKVQSLMDVSSCCFVLVRMRPAQKGKLHSGGYRRRPPVNTNLCVSCNFTDDYTKKCSQITAGKKKKARKKGRFNVGWFAIFHSQSTTHKPSHTLQFNNHTSTLFFSSSTHSIFLIHHTLQSNIHTATHTRTQPLHTAFPALFHLVDHCHAKRG